MNVRGRDAFERDLARAIAEAGASAMREVIAGLGDPPNVDNVPAEVWQRYGEHLRALLREHLERVYRAQAEAMAGNLGKQPSESVDWTLANQRAADWAETYSYELVRGVVDTTTGGINETLQRALREVISTGISDTLTRGQISDALEPYFGPRRAEMIAITEVTRAAAQGEAGLVAQLGDVGIEITAVWHTSADDAVCEICGEYDGQEQGDGWDELPPAHPGCRCFITHRIKGGTSD